MVTVMKTPPRSVEPVERVNGLTQRDARRPRRFMLLDYTGREIAAFMTGEPVVSQVFVSVV
jgi:hypothetical protein